MKKIPMIRTPLGNDPSDNMEDAAWSAITKSSVIESKPKSPLERLLELSTTGRIEEMEKNLSNDSYIFDGMALSGMVTLFYARPNTGKTLFFMRFLIDSIQAKWVVAKDVFYINADDNYKGLLTKTRLAKKHGFNMISPQEAGISPNDILEMILALAKTEDIKGKVIILDTLKKFADMMSKQAQAKFFEALRVVATRGGTVIIAGHANKHNNSDGEMVYEGTSDTMNDIDNSYAMVRISDPLDKKQVVEFTRVKDRGDIIAKATYQYSKEQGMHYEKILDSIECLDADEAGRAAALKRKQDLLDKFEAVHLFVSGILKDGPMIQSVIQSTHKDSKSDLAGEISIRDLRDGLKALTGIAWTRRRVTSNALEYELINAAADRYKRGSDGDF